MDILCPVCHRKLIGNGRSYCCENGHNFDIAREGYLNLSLKNSQKSGDNPDMIRARKAFLEKGYYSFLKEAVGSLLNKEDVMVDLACGEGYYTASFCPKDKTGIDLSKSGLKIASKADRSTLYLLSSIFKTPLPDRSADKVLTIFAPIAREEICRILKDDGSFILVRPDERHLYELKQILYEKPYLNDASEIHIDGLKLEKEIPVSRKEKVVQDDLMNLFMMTPYYNTTSQNDKDKLKQVTEAQISFCFLIDIYRKAA